MDDFRPKIWYWWLVLIWMENSEIMTVLMYRWMHFLLQYQDTPAQYTFGIVRHKCKDQSCQFIHSHFIHRQLDQSVLTYRCVSMISSAICRPIRPAPALVPPGTPGMGSPRLTVVPGETSRHLMMLLISRQQVNGCHNTRVWHTSRHALQRQRSIWMHFILVQNNTIVL